MAQKSAGTRIVKRWFGTTLSKDDADLFKHCMMEEDGIRQSRQQTSMKIGETLPMKSCGSTYSELMEKDIQCSKWLTQLIIENSH